MKKIRIHGKPAPFYLDDIFNIEYEGKAIALRNENPDPYGDGSGKGSGLIWLKESEWNDLIKKGNIRTDEKIDVSDFTIVFQDDEWWVNSFRYNVLVSGATPDLAVEKAKLEINRWK